VSARRTTTDPCTGCGRRPRIPGQRRCRECHAEYMRGWRAGRTSMMLTAEERALVLEFRRELLEQELTRRQQEQAC
jgi:hypothetical protein